MSGKSQPPEHPQSGPASGLNLHAAAVLLRPRFFDLIDWLSFLATSGLALTVYLLTMAPDVTLEFSGLFSTGAFYAGVSHPPGYPLWTLYAWLFIKVLPFSNIAWRAGFATAFAAALTCGILALMVSRCGALLLDGIPGLKRLPRKKENSLRLVSGCVAGLGFGFNGAFWFKAVVADVWPLSLLFLSLVLCLLLRWIHAPERNAYLFTAWLLFGLTLTNSHALPVAAPGIAFMVLFGEPAIGRDVFFASTALLAVILVAYWQEFRPEIVEITRVDTL